MTQTQEQQDEWRQQWTLMAGDEHQNEELFWEWISPLTVDDFRGKRVLDAGCGGGHMLSYIAPYVREGIGIDLNTSEISRERLQHQKHIRIVEGDLARWNDERDFDLVYSIGVVHHTADPQASARHLLDLVKPGGKLALWVYGYEGNALTRWFVEKPKRFLFSWMPRKWLWLAARLLTALIYPVVYTLYALPFRSLPYWAYFQNWKRLTFQRNADNIFDKLNAPTTHFIRRSEIDTWFAGVKDVKSLEVSSWCDISWRILITKRAIQGGT